MRNMYAHIIRTTFCVYIYSADALGDSGTRIPLDNIFLLCRLCLYIEFVECLMWRWVLRLVAHACFQKFSHHFTFVCTVLFGWNFYYYWASYHKCQLCVYISCELILYGITEIAGRPLKIIVWHTAYQSTQIKTFLSKNSIKYQWIEEKNW